MSVYMSNEDIKFEGIVTLKSSLSHIGESFGNQTLLRREKVIQPDMSIEDVPVYSGNALRGQLRDSGVLYFKEKLGFNTMSWEGFHLLFSGGTLTKTGQAVDISTARNMRKLIPLLSVLGGACGNQIMQGKLTVSKLYPLCVECRRQIPEKYHGQIKTSFRLWLQEEEFTRTDDSKNEHLRPIIDTDTIPEKANPQQMRYGFETLAAGAMFYSKIQLHNTNEIERGAFISTLVEFGKRPCLGGRIATGHGECEIDYGSIKINTTTTLSDEMQSYKDAYDGYLAAYQQALMSSQNEITDVLGLETADANAAD